MYAVSTVKSMPWLNTTPTAEKKTKSRKSKQGSEAIYPIFEKCADLTDDPYWKDVLNQASKGKFIRGFSFKTNQLIHKRANKIRKIDINDNPVEMLTACLDFFRSSGIRSEQDAEREKKQLEEQLMEARSVSNLTWTEIRKKKKSLPGLYVESFIREIANDMHLNKNQVDQLTTIINIGFILGYIGDECIEFDGSIRKIHGLAWDNQNHEFILDLQRKSAPKARLKLLSDEELLNEQNEHRRMVSFVEMWNKFLNSLNKDAQTTVSLKFSETPSMEESSIHSLETY